MIFAVICLRFAKIAALANHYETHGGDAVTTARVRSDWLKLFAGAGF